MHDTERWLQALGLGPDATEQQIKDAYRDLVKVWHPDRFQSDPRLYLKAEEKLRELNDAYEHLQQPRPAPAEAATIARMETRPESRTRESAAASGEKRRGSGVTEVQMFAGVAIATAAVVGSILFLGGGREGLDSRDPTLVPGSRPPATAAASSAGNVPQETSPPLDGENANAPDPTPAAPASAGTLAVFSQPSGATVYVDGREVGHTPINLTTVLPGNHQIRLELPDYRVWSSSVRIEAGGGEKILAIFEREPRR